VTPLAATIAARIAATGPITLADYMVECLLHPRHGYYTQRAVFGRAGDFVTAPEISQMFGEMVGLALAQSWLDQGAQTPVTLVELGPGRGTLMADLLRSWRAVPALLGSAELHLVEASPALRAIQADRLAAHRPHWHETADTLPDTHILLIANEFLDALPVRQFTRVEDGWRETVVGLRAERLVPGRSAPAAFRFLEHRLGDTQPGDIVEIQPTLPTVVGTVSKRIATHGGTALFIDYGGWRSRGDTFQAVQKHGYADPFEAPGAADLTAHVDFEAVAQAATCAGAQASTMTQQGLWLARLGLAERAARLDAGLPSGDTRDAHRSAFHRLTDAQEMGSVFKGLGIVPRGCAPPAGLEP